MIKFPLDSHDDLVDAVGTGVDTFIWRQSVQQRIESFVNDDLNDMALRIERFEKGLREEERKPAWVSSMTLTNVFVPRGHEDAGLTYSALVCFDIG
ncbi:hypothetical protein [Amycolatopsis speibonae]|uniref:Uncharacterized protein n=1 Tax=Amycolatopsis speibonae TaxID=1450224 RepID=A0ABV7NZA5_9PSEU